MTTQLLPVGSIGTLPVSLPLVSVGSGRPRIALVTGLHGGEESGIAILRDLLPRLAQLPGEYLLFPSGNPITQATKQRFAFPDGLNPNRAFPGSAEGSLTRRIAYVMTERIGQADLVVDLHCFSQECAFTGILVAGGTSEVRQRAQNAIAALTPDVVWVDRGSMPEGGSSSATLSGAMHQRGIPSIGIEMPRADHLSTALHNRIVDAVVALCQATVSGTLTGSAQPIRCPTIVRHDVRAKNSGFFTSSRRPLEPIIQGSVLGSLTDLETLQVSSVESQASGLLFLVARTGIVRTGDKLYAIGEPITV